VYASTFVLVMESVEEGVGRSCASADFASTTVLDMMGPRSYVNRPLNMYVRCRMNRIMLD
jgi:hypothetical protein